MKTDKKYIIWDWNGTLLNDLEICILAMNSLLKARNLPVLTQERYKENFCFPVRDYYEKIGFDFQEESFEKVGLEFMHVYREMSDEAKLTKNAEWILSKMQQNGIRQFVLSAMKYELLQKMLSDYGIIRYFDAVYGTKDDYGSGKLEIGLRLLSELHLEKDKTMIVGDTLHDAEVADAMGIDCILFSEGHQDEKRLVKTKKRVINDLKKLI